MDSHVVNYREAVQSLALGFSSSPFIHHPIGTTLLGTGGFGSVYKSALFDGTIVAVKVQCFQKIRCRMQGIMLDVAWALAYLLHGQSKFVVHCDLKPSNILLDEDMIAHIGDFGIAKMLIKNKEATQTKTLGTLGYIAPEGTMSIKADTYSYGIILLEMITRKKTSDDMFAGELTLRQWINVSFQNKMMEVVDDGLRCSKELPNERINIKDVIVKLDKIKLLLSENGNKGI
ncbi:hypothetical protein F2P56_035018 [Juglans regia]|uniref:Receptor kinase-like protein Xa21 n=2 Tax=Juglans regia TaxID=51240 RepID=A0A2I4H0V2_JUGRE|nr:receptor kinase-like protein Xa21 [Juglans regia]KAF5442350.1 hypothetical protein F2P56_035018 [Juglans regia]